MMESRVFWCNPNPGMTSSFLWICVSTTGTANVAVKTSGFDVRVRQHGTASHSFHTYGANTSTLLWQPVMNFCRHSE